MEQHSEKRKFQMPSAYSILFLIILAISAVTWLIPNVGNATLADIVMSPAEGFVDAIDVAVFVLVLGGFLGVVSATGALDNGIAAVVAKLKGRETLLIPILMLLFSVGGSTFGMAEETIAFYALIIATMIAAGFDAMVGVAVIMLGAGVGVIGSTVNPFAIAAAVDALKSSHPDIVINQTVIILWGSVLWITSLLAAIFYVLRYAKKVKESGASILTVKELEESKEAYAEGSVENVTFSAKSKWVLIIFAASFLIMIISLIPWESFGITWFSRTWYLTGANLGEWYFRELQAWFLLMAILVGFVYRLGEANVVKAFVTGAADMVGVALVIAVSRGISVIMSETGLGGFILSRASDLLGNVSPVLFTILAYVIYLGLSFLIPSTSGLAAASMPTFGGLAARLGMSPEIMIMIFCAACGLVNLITPTSAVVVGGLSIAKIGWPTWVKFAAGFLGILLVLNLITVCAAMLLV